MNDMSASPERILLTPSVKVMACTGINSAPVNSVNASMYAAVRPPMPSPSAYSSGGHRSS